MTIQEAIQNRHAVRKYLDKEIEPETISALKEEVDICNAESGLNIQLVTNESFAFSGFMARYGKFSGVKNYMALVGKPHPELHEKIGYYGQRLVIKAQQLGLNSCWVAVTFSKGKCGAVINEDEKLVCVIALGYGATQGVPHKSKPLETLCQVEGGGDMPDWFRKGMEAALLAPTAYNQQKFLFTLRENGGVKAQPLSNKKGYARIDLGIAKYHFEVGTGKEGFKFVV